jgi:hypothetical protein
MKTPSILTILCILLLSANILAWTLDKSGVSWDVELTQAEQSKFDIFQNAIANDNLSPRDAAQRAGDTNFKRLSDGSYQIRLSQRARVKMYIDWGAEHVRIVQVGGHT